ncbi:DUF7543 family protein [Haloferacaceae archaeon DSL9]
MSWETVRDNERLTEWERSDASATIRVRKRQDGTFAVRLDRLHQAPGGRYYERETVETREDALDLVDRWRLEYDAE